MQVLAKNVNRGYKMRINRDKYLNELISKMHNKMIKIITGIRRCGKSYLLNAFFSNFTQNRKKSMFTNFLQENSIG